MVDCGVVKYLRQLLTSNDCEIVKEVCWTISNIIAGSPEQVGTATKRDSKIQSIIDNDCVPLIFSLLNSSIGKDVKNEANWVFLNASTCGDDDQIDYFVQNGVIPFLMSLLQTENQCQDLFDALDSILVPIRCMLDY